MTTLGIRATQPSRWETHSIALLLGAMAFLALSCAHSAEAPADALGAFGAAIEKKDHDAAYALMSQSYRRRVTLGEFKRTVVDGGADYAAAVRDLRESAAALGDHIEIAVGGDDRVSLVREGGSWRFDQQPFQPFNQATPRQALRTFVRAAERRRYDVLLRLVPLRFRGVVTTEKLRAFWEGDDAKENQALLRDLRLNLGARIIEDGEEAYMSYGVNRQVRFLREEGLWRIESPE
jgi:hypothetical protein